jgi:predicted acylesterase/phospholipase RssA
MPRHPAVASYCRGAWRGWVSEEYFMKISTGSVRALLIVCVLVMLPACSSVKHRNAVPADKMSDVQVLDNKALYRFSPMEISVEDLEKMVIEGELQYQKSGLAGAGLSERRSQSLLALSGGGAGGAYGAGILSGWSSRGSCPQFRIVTGVSTGALIAPFAFLGPDYNDVLEKLFTDSDTGDILSARNILALFTRDALNDSGPLRASIEAYFDASFLHKVAVEHSRGRRLYIGTTDLDSGRALTWDMGAIASSAHPKALQLFQKVILASSAVPVLFPPVYIPVTVGDKAFEELHVDGGVSSQVFLYPVRLKIGEVADRPYAQRHSDLYVIRNAKLSSEPRAVDARALPIARRSIALLINSQGMGDLLRIQATAARDNMIFHMAHIPESFDVQAQETFDVDQMNALFKLGFEQAVSGYPWIDKIE